MKYKVLVNGEDNKDFDTILSKFLDYQRNLSNKIYSYHQMEFFVESKRRFFTEYSPNEFVVSGGYNNDNEICAFAVGIKLGAVCNIRHDILPQWVLSMTYLEDKEWTSPREKIHNLITPITSKMENDGFYTFYKINKIPSFISDDTASKWLNDVYSKSISNKRYIPVIERIIKTESDIHKLPSIHRAIFPNEVLRPMAIMAHHLRQEIRHYENS